MAADTRAPIVVVAAVIERAGTFLLARRLAGTHLAGRWEFPGGKCEPGESLETCLARELYEELGVHSVVGQELIVIEHEYPERVVRLHFHRCEISGEPHGKLGQEVRWIDRRDLRSMSLPDADEALVNLLSPPAAQQASTD